MQISTKTRYAIMALVEMVHLQKRKGLRHPIKLDKISRRQKLSISYLEQLFMALKKGGIVKSTLGPGGGYTLSKPAEEISLYNIIISVDEPLKFNLCNGMGLMKKGKGCMVDGNPCNTHELWSTLGEFMKILFKDISFKDILDGKSHKILEKKLVKK